MRKKLKRGGIEIEYAETVPSYNSGNFLWRRSSTLFQTTSIKKYPLSLLPSPFLIHSSRPVSLPLVSRIFPLRCSLKPIVSPLTRLQFPFVAFLHSPPLSSPFPIPSINWKRRDKTIFPNSLPLSSPDPHSCNSPPPDLSSFQLFPACFLLSLIIVRYWAGRTNV